MSIEIEQIARELELSKYVEEIDGKLQQDFDSRVNGDGIYVGYNTLRDFYKGKQWSYKPEENGTMRTYNYCFVVVENMTAFLSSEKPEIIHEPPKIADQLERVISEELTKFLKTVHDYNKLHIQFQKGARVGSLTGDTYIIGPFWDDVKKQIFYRTIERPELIRPIWKTDDFTEMAGFILQYRMDLKSAEKLYATQMKERGISSLKEDANAYEGVASQSPTGNQTSQPMVNIKEYWDDDEYIIKINGKVVDYSKHEYGFVPCYHIPNINLPGETKGTSDLENLLDAQQEYNIGSSSEKDILDAVAFPTLWGNNIDNISEIETGRGVIYNVPEESTLNAIQISGNPSVVDNYSANRRTDIVAVSRQNDVTVGGGSSVTQLSGRAMAVMMQGVNNSVNLRKPFWQDAFEELNANILILAERFIPGADELIRGNYRTSVFISSAYMRSVVDELNKLTHKTQSLETTMKNMGIPSPSEEIKIMKEEMKDPVLNIELSRQPGLLKQWEAEEAQASMPPPPVAPSGGAPGQPTLSEGQNQPGESPMAAPGQAIATPAGAVNQQTQQSTQSPILNE